MNFTKKIVPNTLAIYRILVGIIFTFFFSKVYLDGSLQWIFLDDRFHFRYPFFANIPQLSPAYLKSLFVVLIVSSFLFTIGLFYRVATFLSLIIFTYFFLLEASFYNNHYYLMILLLFIFLITDANAKWSVDAWLFKQKKESILNWQLLLFQFQIGVVYFYGGLSKLMNADWLNNSIMKIMLTDIFPNYSAVKISKLSALMTYGGLLYDLVIVFLLLHKSIKVKLFGLLLVVVFNLTNNFLFDIDIFPFLMLASSILFFNGVVTNRINQNFGINNKSRYVELKKVILTSYVFFQLAFPLRHLLVKGNVFYTGEARHFSWHMMSGTISGSTSFLIKDLENELAYKVNPLDYLTEKQNRVMLGYPILALQFADFLNQKAMKWETNSVEIYGRLDTTRNGRKSKPQINSENNLLNEKALLMKHNRWINIYRYE